MARIHRRTIQTGLNDLGNHHGVVTHLKSDILDCEVKWTLGSITIDMNKASGGDGIPAELFKILKDNAVKVLHSTCQKIWKTQWWPQDWKRSVFIPVPKKSNAKECSNCNETVLFSHVSKVVLKILQVRLQELPDVQAEFRKSKGPRNQIANTRWIMKKPREFQKIVSSASLITLKPYDCVDDSKLWKILKEMGAFCRNSQ